MPSAGSTLPLSAAPRDTTSSTFSTPNPLAAVSSFLHHHLSRLGSELSARIDDGRRLIQAAAPLAAAWQGAWAVPAAAQGKHAFDLALSPQYVAKTLAGTAVYTVSNSNHEFVLVSDPNNGLRSLGFLCFRHEDAEALLAQVYMLKVEGIAFRFLPDPLQIRNALELISADISRGFDGVPVFQSDLLVVKKKNKRYCPIYFQKEDIERELSQASRASRGSGFSQHIMVGSLEDVLKKMEMNDKNSGWDDLIFIPPGKSYMQHINEVAA
ncbi:protein TIC 22, chloroplastic isoform X3 [Elaeis guineensis]|uniref:Protein TIC 22, chloroplastic isoform X2 n=1 Tax=Elaeis guineensis var. tenera TaxID=51953 RepID=A0A6I9SGY2_ELAGV|nr:protein TIC 22, chloroplastic isoform X2 [Elaeis guineensis]